MVSVEQIKKLRDETGISIAACKQALDGAGGDIGKAMELLKKEGIKIAAKKSARVLKAGIVEHYVHSNRQVAVLVEVRSETDFVAKNEEFKNFAHNVAMHIAAFSPECADELLSQSYLKRPEITVGEYIKEMIQKFGENIEIGKFFRVSVN